MKVLELFSGTHSVGKVCKQKGWEVISLDLKKADINCNILKWDYTVFPRNYFDMVWASPPCATFSKVKNSWIGRKLKGEYVTFESIEKDIQEIGLPLLNKAKEIIDYFNPRWYCIENPQTGKMKDYITDLPYYDVDYCMYGYPYKKSTRFWTNIKGFIPKRCNKQCGSFFNGKHLKSCGNGTSEYGGCVSISQKYSIPPTLLCNLFDCIPTKVKGKLKIYQSTRLAQ